MSTFVELKDTFFGFVNHITGKGTDVPATSAKARKARRHRRVCRFEELEGREMLSVTPWSLTGAFHDHVHEDDHHDADWAYEISGDSCGVCNAVYNATPEMNQGAEAINGLVANGPIVSLDQTFFLNSNPGAKHTIYLDFTGHTTTGTSWNTSFTGGAPIVTPAFSIDSNPEFSATELELIQNIWQRVAEDYMPFNVNVTTQEPPAGALIKSGSNDDAWGIRVCIGGSSYDWYGSGAGGVAYVGSFNNGTDTPCFVFPGNLGNGNEKYVAEAISHEVGHTLGLRHDGLATPATEYYQGANGWAPIMGTGYYQALTQWSKGEYAGANNTQDDLAIITSGTYGFTYRADDHGNTMATATKLIADGNSVFATGIVERNTDIDMFQFTVVAQGTVSFDIISGSRDANLDILAKIYNSAGEVIAISDSPTTLNASFNNTLVAGIYYLSIEGTGKAGVYSDYGSIGSYTIAGILPAAVSAGLLPPEQLRNSNKTTSSVTLAWNGVSGATGYQVQWRKSGATAWTNISAANTSVTISGLADDTMYEFQVRAINADSESGWSLLLSVKTDKVVVPPATPENFRNTAQTTSAVTLAWNAVNGATGYQVQCRKSGTTAWTNISSANTSVSISGLASDTMYEFQVRAINADGESGWSSLLSVKTDKAVVPPATPANLQSTSKTTDSITLAWNAVSGATGYQVQWKKSGETAWTNISAANTSVTISGLTDDTGYEFQVRATNADGESGWSSLLSVKTDKVVVPPTAPANFHSTAQTVNSVTLAWNSQAGLTGYTLQYKASNSSTWQTWTSAPGANATSATITGLTANTAYDFRLTASNSAGTASSDIMNVTTPKAPAADPVKPVLGVDSKQTTANSVTLTLASQNKNQDITGNAGYTITCTVVTGNGNGNKKAVSETVTLVAGVDFEYIMTNGAISGVKVFGLDADTQYELSVTAMNADGKAASAVSIYTQTATR